jgi:hypothetical protein
LLEGKTKGVRLVWDWLYCSLFRSLGNAFLDGGVSFFGFDNDLVVFGIHSDAGLFSTIIGPAGTMKEVRTSEPITMKAIMCGTINCRTD